MLLGSILFSTITFALPMGVKYSCAKPGLFAFTFDDGVTENYKPLLEILKKEKVKVTFFVIGETLLNPRKAKLLKMAADDGHLIANHMWSHSDLTKMSNDAIIKEVKNTQNGINTTLNTKVKSYLRPPYGSIDQRSYRLLADMGYTVVIWNLDTRDWNRKNSKGDILSIFNRILSKSSPTKDSIISLQHERRLESVYLVPTLISLVKAKGYRIVTIDECLKG